MKNLERKILFKTELLTRGLTQMQVAHSLEVSESLLSRVINGHTNPKPDLRKVLADLLGVAEGTLFGPCESCSGDCNCGD
jgi:transcriptional regulator with XRE-family HTH domain